MVMKQIALDIGLAYLAKSRLQNALDAHYAELRASGYVTPGAPRSTPPP